MYFWGGNGAEDPPAKQVVGEAKDEVGNSSPSPSVSGRDVAAKFPKKPFSAVVWGTEELPKRRKERKAASRRGDAKG